LKNFARRHGVRKPYENCEGRISNKNQTKKDAMIVGDGSGSAASATFLLERGIKPLIVEQETTGSARRILEHHS